MLKVGVLGGTGYAGQELIRLLFNHKEVEVKHIISESHQEKEFSYVYRNFKGFNDTVCEKMDLEAVANEVDVLFSALSYGVLMEKLSQEILKKVKIIDIGVDYRFMDKEEYKKYYRKDHKSIELSKAFTYGLCEWNERRITDSDHIANPGCFATAMELALLPLFSENVIENKVIIDGKSSLSGSGRTLSVGTHYVEANESTKPYRITNHPHTNEFKKAMQLFLDKNVDITFVPHIVPIQRGILITCYTIPKLTLTHEFVHSIFKKYYCNTPFVRVLDKGMYVETKWVRNSNMCHINFEIDKENNSLIIFAAIDNLIKGAAGQAIQNMNIMYGFPQTMALDFIPTCL